MLCVLQLPPAMSGIGSPSGWSTGSDSNPGTSISAPSLTLHGAFSKMAGGDTFIIGNSTYNDGTTITSSTGKTSLRVEVPSPYVYDSSEYPLSMARHTVVPSGNNRTECSNVLLRICDKCLRDVERNLLRRRCLRSRYGPLAFQAMCCRGNKTGNTSLWTSLSATSHTRGLHSLWDGALRLLVV